MGKQKTPVSGNEVRQWAADNRPDLIAVPREGETFARGRVSKAVQEAYMEANPGTVYVPGYKTERTFTLTERTLDKNGRKRSRKVEVSLSQVRELAGEVCASKGLPSAAALEAAEQALSEQAQARKASANA